MPDWIRPTELQVFVPHIDMLDCISWPYFRDYIIQHPEMQHGELQWLAACTSGVQVHWDGTIEEAICVDGVTGRKRFTPEAEVSSQIPIPLMERLMVVGCGEGHTELVTRSIISRVHARYRREYSY